MKIQISAVGNFCMYPRSGVLVAIPVGGWPNGWRRGAKALGFETEAGGVVIGTVRGYDSPRYHNGVYVGHPKVSQLLDWMIRHPEAAAASRPDKRDGEQPPTLEGVGSAFRRCVEEFRNYRAYFQEWPRDRFHFKWAISPQDRWRDTITPAPLP